MIAVIAVIAVIAEECTTRAGHGRDSARLTLSALRMLPPLPVVRADNLVAGAVQQLRASPGSIPTWARVPELGLLFIHLSMWSAPPATTSHGVQLQSARAMAYSPLHACRCRRRGQVELDTSQSAIPANRSCLDAPFLQMQPCTCMRIPATPGLAMLMLDRRKHPRSHRRLESMPMLDLRKHTLTPTSPPQPAPPPPIRRGSA